MDSGWVIIPVVPLPGVHGSWCIVMQILCGRVFTITKNQLSPSDTKISFTCVLVDVKSIVKADRSGSPDPALTS